jgi:DNA (cytosine-5)-methyltransferase 1
MVTKAMIANHFSPTLSDLDLQMVKAVPQGGNWKDIPDSIPSARLEQIRASYAAGGGSRSTYYGRLHPDAPAYTIGTYFNRPGNGCFIHYGADRLLSQREAARLQSFPDSFLFLGSQREVNQQIGNAVPPVLAYQIARTLGMPGSYVDLFSGAGGLSLGFKWAGWRSTVANDINGRFLETYAHNVHANTVVGDISDPSVVRDLVSRAISAGLERPFAILGGPPCQGFSTAGKKRSMGDLRNHLFKSYVELMSILKPDLFIFENVTGLLNMDGGTVLASILEELSLSGYNSAVWKLKTEQYGLPQRRHRIFIVGVPLGKELPQAPLPITPSGENTLFSGDGLCPPTVREALGDLPPLSPGERPDQMGYLAEPENLFQRLMRGKISVQEYLEAYRTP